MLKRIIDKLGIKNVDTRKKFKRNNSSVNPLYNPRKNPPPLIENALRENNFSNVGTRTRSPHTGPSIPNAPSQAKNVYKQELDLVIKDERKLTQELNLILTSIYKPDIDEKAFREKKFKEKAMRKGASYTIEQYKAEVNKKLKEEKQNLDTLLDNLLDDDYPNNKKEIDDMCLTILSIYNNILDPYGEKNKNNNAIPLNIFTSNSYDNSFDKNNNNLTPFFIYRYIDVTPVREDTGFLQVVKRFRENINIYRKNSPREIIKEFNEIIKYIKKINPYYIDTDDDIVKNKTKTDTILYILQGVTADIDFIYKYLNITRPDDYLSITDKENINNKAVEIYNVLLDYDINGENIEKFNELLNYIKNLIASKKLNITSKNRMIQDIINSDISIKKKNNQDISVKEKYNQYMTTLNGFTNEKIEIIKENEKIDKNIYDNKKEKEKIDKKIYKDKKQKQELFKNLFKIDESIKNNMLKKDKNNTKMIEIDKKIDRMQKENDEFIEYVITHIKQKADKKIKSIQNDITKYKRIVDSLVEENTIKDEQISIYKSKLNHIRHTNTQPLKNVATIATTILGKLTKKIPSPNSTITTPNNESKSKHYYSSMIRALKLQKEGSQIYFNDNLKKYINSSFNLYCYCHIYGFRKAINKLLGESYVLLEEVLYEIISDCKTEGYGEIKEQYDECKKAINYIDKEIEDKQQRIKKLSIDKSGKGILSIFSNSKQTQVMIDKLRAEIDTRELEKNEKIRKLQKIAEMGNCIDTLPTNSPFKPMYITYKNNAIIYEELMKIINKVPYAIIDSLEWNGFFSSIDNYTHQYYSRASNSMSKTYKDDLDGYGDDGDDFSKLLLFVEQYDDTYKPRNLIIHYIHSMIISNNTNICTSEGLIPLYNMQLTKGMKDASEVRRIKNVVTTIKREGQENYGGSRKRNKNTKKYKHKKNKTKKRL